jgi:hypothetical protein
MMKRVRNLPGLVVWPAAGLAAIVGLTILMLWLGDSVPNLVTAVVTSSSIVLAVGSWAVWHYPPLYFWRQKFAAALGRRIAPGWKLRLAYQSRVSPAEREIFTERLSEERLAFGRLRVEERSEHDLELILGPTHFNMRWDEPRLDEDGTGQPDWFVSLDVDYPPVPYNESIRFLRLEVMPVLEAVERALDVTPSRSYRLVVEYPRGANPFEGLLIRAAPDQTVTNYSVILRPDPRGEERIELSREGVALTAVSRSRFEELVERLLTLDGSWPVAFLDSMR